MAKSKAVKKSNGNGKSVLVEKSATSDNVFHRSGFGEYISSIILGANDGIITTFVVVAGATGASLEPVVIVILGFANVLGDAVSMGMGNYLGEKSAEDYNRGQRTNEEQAIETHPEEERSEVREIFKKWNFAGKDLDRAVEIVTSDKKTWVDIMMRQELGIVERGFQGPIKEGVITFVAFIVAGSVPLIPFLLPALRDNGAFYSMIFSGVELFSIGAMRAFISPQKWIKGGLEMLAVGAIASGLAYAVGYYVDKIINNF